MLAALITVVILIVITGILAFRAQIRARTVENTVEAAGVLSSVVIDRNVTLTDITYGMRPVSRSALHSDVILLKRRGEVANLAIWALPTKELVYADVPAEDAVVPAPEVFARAQTGAPQVGTTSANPAHSGDLVVYYPYDANGDGTMDAVAEVVLPTADFEASISQSSWLLYGGGLLVLVLAIAGVLQVRRHQLSQDYAAVHDSLTGLGNRMLLRRVTPKILAEATRSRPSALLLIDLDNFKAVNDTLGHQAGDELLIAVAEIIEQESGPSAVAVRLGGDEFAVLLPRVSDPAAARDVPGRIRAAIRCPLTIAGADTQVDASIGIAWAPSDGAELDDLLRSADMAMYRAKHSGDGVAEYTQVVTASPPQPPVTTARQLSQALANHELEVFYQPVQATDSTIIAVEALPRWRHPELGLLEASMFIPSAEHTSLMSTLTAWVLRQAADQHAHLQAIGLNVKVTVNVSAQSLYGDSIASLVESVIEQGRLPADALELEVSEADFLIQPDRAIAAMLRLRSVGAALCLDNFGAAYGAVSVLADAPVQTVKIDQRFSARVVESSLAKTVVSGWVKAAHHLNLDVVAQGVETSATWRCLIDLGCDGVQGYGICRPMPARELTQWLTRSNTTPGAVGAERRIDPDSASEAPMAEA